MLYICSAAFVGGSIATALARNFNVVLVGRTLQVRFLSFCSILHATNMYYRVPEVSTCVTNAVELILKNATSTGGGLIVLLEVRMPLLLSILEGLLTLAKDTHF